MIPVVGVKGMLSAEDLTKRFGSVVAVSNATFTVRTGAVTGLLGQHGSGKSTTLRLLLGLTQPTSGTALVDGKPLHEWPVPGRKVGAALDPQCAHPRRRAIDSVRWAVKLAGAERARAEALLDRVGLAEVAGLRTGAFSLGMRQRLALAIALAGDPETLVLDEPFNGLDAASITWLKDLLRAYRDEGRTVFVASHLLAELEDLVDDLVVIAEGKIIGSGPADAFIDRFPQRMITVLCDTPERLAAAVLDAGGRVADTNGQRMLIGGLSADQLAVIAREADIAISDLTDTRGLRQTLTQDTPEIRDPRG